MTNQESVFTARCRCADCENKWTEPAQLFRESYRCSACGSYDIDIDVTTSGDGEQKRPWWEVSQ